MIHTRSNAGLFDPGKPRTPLWLLLAGVMTLWVLLLGAQPAHAQGSRVCRDQDDITICGDEFRDFTFDLGIDGYQIIGNLTIGMRGAPPVVRVTDAALLSDQRYRRATFEHVEDPRKSPWGTDDVLFGDVSFINDPKQRAPIGVKEAEINGNKHPGFFVVDTTRSEGGPDIVASAPNALLFDIPAYPDELKGKDGKRTQVLLFSQFYLDHLGLSAMYAEEASVHDRSNWVAIFDLQNRKFTVDLTIPKLRLFENAENPQLPITMQITMDEQGNYAGKATKFKMRMAGMTGEVNDITVKPGELEAKSLSFSRADNPSLPNLDPSDPNLVFRLESVKYRDGHFAVGGVVGIKDWQLGNAMRLTNQSVGLFVDNVLKTTSIVISSTLTFPARSVATDGSQYPMRIEIGAKKVGEGFMTFGKGLLRNPNRPQLNFGAFSLGMPISTTFTLDPQRNFYGMEADKVALKWKGELGGQTGFETSFKLGVNSQRELVFALSGGTIAMPEMKSGALSVQLAGTVNNNVDTVNILLKGTVKLFLPGNSAVAPTAEVKIITGGAVCGKICTPIYQMTLSGFELKVAGFTLGLTNPRGTPDGGYAADKVTLKVPVGINSFGGQITGFKVTGTNDISITGGSFELPPLTIGKISFVGVKGSFIKNATGGYEFRGAGVMPLPGLDPSGGPGGKKISVDVIVRTQANGDFSGMGVKVEFSTGVPGIPIGSTGMELLAIGGSFDLNNGTAKIGVSMKAGSTVRIGSLPAATLNAKAELQINPFLFTANGELSILIFKMASAQMGIGAGQGFNGAEGFNVSFEINQIIVHGAGRLRIGKVTLSTGARVTAFTAEASWAVGIKKDQFGRFLPPIDLFFTEKKFQGGFFRHKSGSEHIGLKTTVGCCIFFDATVFADFTNGFDVSFINSGDYKLIDETQVRAAIAAAEVGYEAQQVLASEVMPAELLSAAALDATATVLQESIPVELKQRGNALFGIAYPVGAPILRLQLPNGTILTEQTVDNTSSGFLRNTGTISEPHEVAFMLKDAQPGVYTLILDNAPAQYEQVSYVLNQPARVSNVNVTCGGEAMAGVTVVCNGAASGAAVNIGWQAADADNAEATVRISYSAVLSDDISLDGSNQTVIADGLALGTGNVTWQLGEVPSGRYKVVVAADDGINAASEVIAETLIQVTDQRAPAVPGGLQAQPLPGELFVTWAPNNEKDVAGYEIGFGVVDPTQPDDAGRFIYSRDMGSKQVELTTGNLLDAKLWGLTDNQPVFVGIRVYDISGNYSAWSPLLRATPWALSPAAWTPTPNVTATVATQIEVAFETALISETLVSALDVRMADGTPVTGELHFLTNLDEQIVGLSFQPAGLLADGASYTATLKGGANGVRATDGRQMLADYTWRFTASAALGLTQVYLPMVAR